MGHEYFLLTAIFFGVKRVFCDPDQKFSVSSLRFVAGAEFQPAVSVSPGVFRTLAKFFGADLDFYYGVYRRVCCGFLPHFTGSGKNFYTFGEVYGIWIFFRRVWSSFLMAATRYLLNEDMNSFIKLSFLDRLICIRPDRFILSSANR